MQEHHRKLIAEQADAWVQDAHLHGTERSARICYTQGNGWVTLEESRYDTPGGLVARTTVARFHGDEMPLTAQMIRDRFANPFGGPK